MRAMKPGGAGPSQRRPAFRPGRDVLISLRKYDSGLHPTLCYYMALAGLTLAQIAEQIGVSDRTLDTWVKVHPELRAAMKPGKDFVDNLVEGSLLKRAMGYDVVEVTRENVVVGFKPDGAPKHKLKVTKKVTKHIPADPASMIVWMKNRKGWRDRVDLHHGGSIATRPDYSRLTDEEIKTMQALAAKAEANASGN